MPIIGFNFTKIQAERGPATGNYTVKSDLKLTSVEKQDLHLGKSDDVLKFAFDYISNYHDAGSILLSGYLLYLDDPARVEEVLHEWKQKRQLPKDLLGVILNNILFRANIQAVQISQQINLPPPFKLPRVVPKDTGDSTVHLHEEHPE